MLHLLSGAFQFVLAVFGRWQIWLSGGGAGGFMVIVAGVIEKITGRALSRRKYLLIFVIAFFLCSCLLAWIDEHDVRNGLDAKLQTASKQISNQADEFRDQISGLRQGAAVKEAVSQTLQKQNRDQQSTINGCLSQAMKLLTPEPLRITPLVFDNETASEIKKVRWLVVTNKTITPVQMNVVCSRPFEDGSVWVVGSGMMGGGASKIAPQVLGIGVSTPAWSPTSPLLVTMSYRGDNDLACSFVPR